MLTIEVINKAKDFAISESQKYSVPSVFQIELSVNKAIELAKKLNANIEVVTLGTYLMDCMLGFAYANNRMPEHAQLSNEKAIEILSEFKEISKNDLDTISACILEHHGVSKFSSLEAEICCDADCYRFASVRGVIGGIKNMRDMEIDKIVPLYIAKADEKWNALSLDICRTELESDYKLIKSFLGAFK